MARTFTVCDEDERDGYEWLEGHEKECPLTGKYLGAISGKYTWSFTGTSIGEIINLECACGAKHCCNTLI